MLQHTQTVLPSGLTVITIPMASVKSATVLVLANTGSRYEESRQFGVAHFFEHMVFKGTQKYSDALSLSSAVDAVGANFNAFTSKEYTGYYVEVASEHVPLALDVVSDMILTPRLREEDLAREKGVIVEELNMYVDTPSRHISDLFDRMAFLGSHLEHDVIGTKETILGMQRADFINFLHDWYGLHNLVVAVAGDAVVINEKKLLSTIERYFSKKTDGERSPLRKQKSWWHDQPISDQRLLVENRKTEQAHLILAWPGLKRTAPERYALALLGTILGGNMSSRLFTEVREKRGLCYYVHSDVDQYHDTGLVGASAGVDPNRVDEALRVIKAEFESVASGEKPITAAELAKAKDYIAGKLVLGLEDSQSVAQFYGMKQLLFGKVETPETVLEKYRAVNLEAVMAIAQKLIVDKQARLAVIGPFVDQRNFEQVIQ